jgi:site-specific DNA-methyltransferase (adenine-specific)
MKIAFQNENVTLWHGDCREAMAAMPAESVDLLWTDPPYGHGNNDGDLASARVGVAGARQRPVETIANDGADEMRVVLDAMLTEAARVLKRDCCCCCCCCCGGGPRPTFAWVAQRMDAGGFAFFHSVIWDKTARGPGMGWRYRRDHEMLMIAHRSGGRLRWADPDKAVSNIVRTMPPREREHPNEKPVTMVQHFIGLHSLPGDTVLDPFCGSGTTLIAALETGRKAIGIEIDERWVEVARRRLERWHAQGRLDFGSKNGVDTATAGA